MTFLEFLRCNDACSPALSWISQQPDQSPEALWNTCPDSSFMVWALDLLPLTDEIRGLRTQWAEQCTHRALTVHVPAALLAAAACHPVEKHRNALLKHAETLSEIKASYAASYAARAASYAASDAASYAASYAARAASDAARAASYAASDAARAASDAARAASYAASDAASYAASYAARAASYAASYAASDAASYAASDAASYAASYAELKTQADALRALVPWSLLEPLLDAALRGS